MQTVDTRKLIPLHKVVAAAMADSYSDISHAGVEQLYQHWASRGFAKLNNEVLKTGIIKTLLTVNHNTKTATLPLGFKEETFVGVINNHGQKVAIRSKSSIIDTKGIEDVPCEDKCPKCNSNKAICKDLQVTEDTVLVVIGGSTYEQTIIKKLYPDGRYYLETRIPVLNMNTSTVEYTTQKEFIATISLKPCGCVEETESNISTIQTCCPDVYCSYFAPSCNVSLDAGYRIFEESGLIQFGNNFNFDKVYLEYRGLIPKIKGQYQIPEVCFETLVNWTKFKSVENKNNVPLSIRNWYWERYTIERNNMRKMIGRLSMSQYIHALSLLPKFDYDILSEEFCCTPVSPPVLVSESNDSCNTGTSVSCPPTSGKSYIPFEYAGITGIGNGPTDQATEYQNDKFKNAIGINFIIIDNSTYSKNKAEFDLDTDTGIITLNNGNKFFTGMSLIVPTFFKLI